MNPIAELAGTLSKQSVSSSKSSHLDAQIQEAVLGSSSVGDMQKLTHQSAPQVILRKFLRMYEDVLRLDLKAELDARNGLKDLASA